LTSRRTSLDTERPSVALFGRTRVDGWIGEGMRGDRDVEPNATQKQTLEEILRVVVASRDEALVSSAETGALLREVLAALRDGKSRGNTATDLPDRGEKVAVEPGEEVLTPSAEQPSNLLEALAALAATELGEHPATDLSDRGETVASPVESLQADEPTRGVEDEADSSAAEERALADLRELAVEAGLDTDNDSFHRKSCGQMVWPWKGGVDGGPALCPVCGLPNGEFLRTGGDRRKALEKMAEADRREGIPQVPLGSIGRWVQDRRREQGAD